MKSIRIWMPIILLMLAYSSNAVMDILSHKHDQSIFSDTAPVSFWGNESWKLKYAMYEDGQLMKAPDKWYYNQFGLKYKERFLLSATALVFITDGWHLMQFIMWLCVLMAVAIAMRLTPKKMFAFILFVKVLGGFLFEYLYSKKLNKK